MQAIYFEKNVAYVLYTVSILCLYYVLTADAEYGRGFGMMKMIIRSCFFKKNAHPVYKTIGIYVQYCISTSNHRKTISYSKIWNQTK